MRVALLVSVLTHTQEAAVRVAVLVSVLTYTV